MKVFQSILFVMFFGILILTIYAVNIQGLNLFKYAVLTGWQGQFNFDFFCYLLLSGLWIAWREKFSQKGILLGLIASVGGIFFFAPYLFILTLKTKGNLKEILLGKNN